MSDPTTNTPKNKAKIIITPNGPYVVTGGVPVLRRYPAMSTHGEPLAWDPVGVDESHLPVEESYELCRCGHSNNKPYCDGTHETVNFDGTLDAKPEAVSKDRVRYRGEGLVLTDAEGLCVHAGFCGTRFTNVWKMIRHTSDPEVRARLIEMAQNCPSGRLEVTLEGESAPSEPTFRPSIATVPDGPLWVRGGIEIETPDGTVYETRNRVTLCRCGASHNKPFCDGAHEESGFKAPLETQE